MTDIAALVDRLEQAGPESQAELLKEAWLIIHHGGYEPEGEWDGCRKCDRFTAMLDCGAYVSAAEMLVDREGDWPQVTYMGPNPNNRNQRHRIELWPKGGNKPHKRHANTWALALAAACLRAAIAGKEG